MAENILPGPRRIVSLTSIVQLEYSPHPLPKPFSTAQEWTRFVIISDNHAHTFPVPDGDVLLHCGDLTSRGTHRDLRLTMEWLYALPHPVKIIIAGNRDFALDRPWYDLDWQHTGHREKQPPGPNQELLTGPRAISANIVYLQNQMYRFKIREGGKKWSVCGSPQTPNFGARVRAFGYDAPNAEAFVAQFPQTDILLTHGPPHGVLDLTKHAARAGCLALSQRVNELRPRLHAFGHIHEARRAYVHLWDNSNEPGPSQLVDDLPAGEQTVFVNAANSVWPNCGQDRWGSRIRRSVALVSSQSSLI
ncbi:Metallo-dependent phosphatase-like protein [Mycena rebaudengoi]|nr:Metallo-dependent phosphatase-like protein [Mycena rebaudengoi]